ncbi:MAG: hypothetical protein AAGA54_17490 [Myxococcota bacterium]
MLTAAVLAALSAVPVEPEEPRYETGEVMVKLLQQHAKTARRERLVRGGVGIGLASIQLGLGIYGQVELGDETGTQRAAIGQLVAGSVSLVNGLVQVAVPSPIERLRRSEATRQVADAPRDAEAVDVLRETWADAANKAKRRRRVSGGLTLGLGALVGVIASVRLADSTGSERQWAFSTVTSSLGMVGAGIAAVVLPSEDERSYAAFDASHPRRPKPAVRVGVGPRGLSLSGRF